MALVSERESPATTAQESAPPIPAAPASASHLAPAPASAVDAHRDMQAHHELATHTLARRSCGPVAHGGAGATASAAVNVPAGLVAGQAACAGHSADLGHHFGMPVSAISSIRTSRASADAARGGGGHIPLGNSPHRVLGVSDGGACLGAGGSPNTERNAAGSVYASPSHASTFPRDTSAFRFDPAFLASHWQAVNGPSAPPGVELAAALGDLCGPAHASHVVSGRHHRTCGGEAPADAERASAVRVEGERSSRTADRAVAAALAAAAGRSPPQGAPYPRYTPGASAGAAAAAAGAAPFAPVSPHRGAGEQRDRSSAGLTPHRSMDPDPAMQALLSLGLVNAAAYHKARRRASEAGGSTPRTPAANGGVYAPFILPGPYLPPGATTAIQQGPHPGRKQRRMSAVEAGPVRSQFNANEVFGVIRRVGSVAMLRDSALAAAPAPAGSHPSTLPSSPGMPARVHPAGSHPGTLPPSPSMPARGQQAPPHPAALPASPSMPTRGQQAGPHPAALPPSVSMPGRVR